MARITPTLDPRSPADHTSTVVTTAGIIGALYFGSEILIPIALAVLLSFALAPAVKALQKLGLGRVFPVVLTVLITVMMIGALGMLLATQLRDLSADLPRYEGTVLRKIETVKGLTTSGGLRRVEDAVAQLSRAIGRGAPAEQSQTASPAAPAATPGTADKAAPPMLVQVVQPALAPLDAILLVSMPLLHPLGMGVVVMIFVVFILLQREDLRNRAIRLFGASDLQRATAAINDGGKRLSRYLLTQLALNTSAGLLVGLVLWVVGVPSPVLLGILFAISRFIPYIGAVMGAVLPILLATAVDPGWSMVIWTIAALGVVEFTIGQIVEPFAYGHNTGLSPIAVVLAATFWTVLWGPVGLLLSTPLTVCLVVLGRHVESLAFLDVLLGDRPPLTADEIFYQRMLAHDPVEAADQAQRCLGEMSIGHYYDQVALPALLMAQEDATLGRLDAERLHRIAATAMDVVDVIDQEVGEDGVPRETSSLFTLGKTKSEDAKEIDDLVTHEVPDALKPPGSLLCIGARGPLDDAAAAMLAQIFVSHGIGARAEGFARLSRPELATLDLSGVRMIVLSCLDGSSAAFLRFLLRRLQRQAPGIEVVVGTWWRLKGRRDTDDAIDEAIHNTKVATFRDAVRHCFAERPGDKDERPLLSVAS